MDITLADAKREMFVAQKNEGKEGKGALGRNMIKISLPGEPVAKIRPRICKNFSYDPQDKLKIACRFQILEMLQHENVHTPYGPSMRIHLDMNFYMTPKKGEEKLPGWGITENTSKKDCDNLCKFYLDAMNGIVYADDKQVEKITAQKYYHNEPRTEITIMAKRQSISDKTKEVLSYMSVEDFISIAEDLEEVAGHIMFVNQNEGKQQEIDHLSAAQIICEIAEKYAETLTKIKKKFPGYAKILSEELKKYEGLL